MSQVFDDAIVGAGILGLAHAYQLARRGRRVIVLEKRPRAEGASIRNFGMLWPIGQPAGPVLQLALKSLEHWLTVLPAAGLWHQNTGSLHLAYHEDEAQVLQEFVAESAPQGRPCEILDAKQTLEHCRWVRPHGLKLAMWSPTEVCVDPRQVIARLPGWLHKTYGVQFAFEQTVIGFEAAVVRSSATTWQARQLIVCTGDDWQALYPESLARSGLMRCKLQMMRSRPYTADVRLGTMLAAGLTLTHYKSFCQCPSLPALRKRIAAELPDHFRHGIHVMAAQNGLGEVIIGDSHEYGEAIEPFDKPAIDKLIFSYLLSFLTLPDLEIAERWHGTYAKHPTDHVLVVHPAPQATVVTAVGGAGMTLSFGLADHVVSRLLGESADAA